MPDGSNRLTEILLGLPMKENTEATKYCDLLSLDSLDFLLPI